MKLPVWVFERDAVPTSSDAEVEQLDPQPLAAHQEHVVGLEVAVDDVLGVGRGQRREDLVEDRARLGARQHAALEAIAQRLALEPLHHAVVAPVGQLPEREDVDDVGVADLVDRPGLAQEAVDRHRLVRELVVEHLDRDPLADDRVDRAVDDAHAAGAQPRGDPVLADQHAGRQIGGDLGQLTEHAGVRVERRRATGLGWLVGSCWGLPHDGCSIAREG
jgi:hypothetical protein